MCRNQKIHHVVLNALFCFQVVDVDQLEAEPLYVSDKWNQLKKSARITGHLLFATPLAATAVSVQRDVRVTIGNGNFYKGKKLRRVLEGSAVGIFNQNTMQFSFDVDLSKFNDVCDLEDDGIRCGKP